MKLDTTLEIIGWTATAIMFGIFFLSLSLKGEFFEFWLPILSGIALGCIEITIYAIDRNRNPGTYRPPDNQAPPGRARAPPSAFPPDPQDRGGLSEGAAPGIGSRSSLSPAGNQWGRTR